MRPIYLDFNATTPLDPRVFEAMRPYYESEFGNAASRTHVYGQTARAAVERARDQIASTLGRHSREIVFTSGATESNNLVLLGLVGHGLSTRRKHILATCIEHNSVLGPLGKLGDLGFDVELLPVSVGGYLDPDIVRRRLRSDTLLVSVMHANNETGVIQPVHEVARLLADTSVLLHVDAAQTFGKEVEELKCLDYDLLSVSGHKIYGPSGVGAVVVRRRKSRQIPVTPIMYGGGQERGLRPGTLPVPLIVGFGAAAELAGVEHCERAARAESVKRQLLAALGAVYHEVNGDLAMMQSHVVNVSFPGVDSEALMLALRSGFAMSNGAACTSSGHKPSHVLKAMGLSDDRIASAVRLSWGPGVQEIPHAAFIQAVSGLRW